MVANLLNPRQNKSFGLALFMKNIQKKFLTFFADYN